MSEALVEPIRDASRRLVRELGFMKPVLAGTGMPPSAVHALIEIGAGRAATGGELADILHLDKSSVSRMLRKLVAAGVLSEGSSAADGRAKPLSLTPTGRETLAAIDAFARVQVKAALATLPPEAASVIHRGLATYAQALAAPAPRPEIRILPGYRPGVVGRCAELHATYYARTVGFGAAFEAKVAGGMAEFVQRLASPRNRLWSALDGETIVGTVAIDGEDLGGNVAHLRWFIVADGYRGSGIGRKLLAEAVAFCDAQAFAEIRLWTLAGLEAARQLYLAQGFALAEEWLGDQWGKPIAEQRYVRVA
jgi:DNA-binding MarR family transcriptional regulator/GNAT superfamily N-acetyltransferase